MATYRDPVRAFAPLEVIERLLEIRAEAGFAPVLFVQSAADLATTLDAYGFDVYAFREDAQLDCGRYRAPYAPGGDCAHRFELAH